MLDRIAGVPGCLFVTVPDVVGDAQATAELFDTWAPELERRGLPVALVLQDGVEDLAWLDGVWDRLAAVFVGGTDDFKLGPAAAELAREAKRRGLWVHWGRVNTKRRIAHISETGAADSFDGSSWAIFRKAIANKRTGERKLEQGSTLVLRDRAGAPPLASRPRRSPCPTAGSCPPWPAARPSSTSRRRWHRSRVARHRGTRRRRARAVTRRRRAAPALVAERRAKGTSRRGARAHPRRAPRTDRRLPRPRRLRRASLGQVRRYGRHPPRARAQPR